MTTQVDLCNLALLRIGTRSTITSLSDGSPEANACALIYPQFLNRILSDFDWKWARLRATLTSQTNTRAEWAYEFALPGDCVRLRTLGVAAALTEGPDLNPGQFYSGRIPFEAGYSTTNSGPAVWAQATGLYADYTSNLVSPSGWMPSFAEAFTWGLAYELCATITSNGQMAEYLNGKYQAALSEAQDVDTNISAMASQGNEPWVDLCNQALVMLGSVKTIRSITDGTAEAAACGQIYPMIVNEIFGLHQWRFANRRIALTAQTNTSTQWSYEYPVPADCARVRSLVDPSRTPQQYIPDRRLFDRQIKFDIGYSATNNGSALWCNKTPILLEYTSNAMPVVDWSPALRSAIVFRLASALAMPILRDAKISQALAQEFAPLLQKAIEMDGGMEAVSINYVPDWIQVRGCLPWDA